MQVGDEACLLKLSHCWVEGSDTRKDQRIAGRKIVWVMDHP